MLDSEIVAAIAAGDADGLAAAYDRYAAPLHAFCCALLTEPAAAAEAVQDTFIIAAARLAGLRDRECLKLWLYAVARNECRRRLRARVPDEAGGAAGDPVDFGVDLEYAELREVVGSAIAGLNASEREVMELSLRQDFSGDDLSRALGVSSSQAETLAADACRQFEKSLGALLVARTGRLDCAKLDELLEGWDGQPTALLRKRLDLHIQHCRTCSGRRDRELEPAMLLSVLPVMAIARGQRQHVLGLVASGAPDAVAYRSGVLRRAGVFEESGFPDPVDPPEPERKLRRQARAFAAVAVIAALGAVGLELGQHHPHGLQPTTAALGQLLPKQPRTALPSQLPGTTRALSPARDGSAPVLPSATPSLSAPLSRPVPGLVRPTSGRTAGYTPPPGPSGTPTPQPTSPSPAPSPTPTPTPTPTATVSASPASVTLGLSPSGGAPSGSFTLTATGGTVSFSVTVPSQYAAQLVVSQTSGTLAAGTSVTITVTWQSSAALQTALSIGPGGQAVSVSYQPLLGAQGTALK